MNLYELLPGDCLELMRTMQSGTVDLTVTSPPYDDLRSYNGFKFDFEEIAKELYRITKEGGGVVWVVGDETKKGSESGTSFRQALFFKDVCGFNLHDTMIYMKDNPPPVGGALRYFQAFETVLSFPRAHRNPLTRLRNLEGTSGTTNGLFASDR